MTDLTDNSDWIKIRYFEFSDVPRFFAIVYRGSAYLLSAPFEETLDDYREDYYVWKLTERSAQVLDSLSGSDIEKLKETQLSDYPIKAAKFKDTRETCNGKYYAWISTVGLERLGS